MKKVLISAYVPTNAVGNRIQLDSLCQRVGDLFHTVMQVSDDGSLTIAMDHSGPVHELLVSVSGTAGSHFQSLNDLINPKRRLDIDTSQINLPVRWKIGCNRDDTSESLKLAFDERTRLIYIVEVREDHEAVKTLQAQGGQGKNALVSLAESLAGVMASPTAEAQ